MHVRAHLDVHAGYHIVCAAWSHSISLRVICVCVCGVLGGGVRAWSCSQCPCRYHASCLTLALPYPFLLPPPYRYPFAPVATASPRSCGSQWWMTALGQSQELGLHLTQMTHWRTGLGTPLGPWLQKMCSSRLPQAGSPFHRIHVPLLCVCTQPSCVGEAKAS